LKFTPAFEYLLYLTLFRFRVNAQQSHIVAGMICQELLYLGQHLGLVGDRNGRATLPGTGLKSASIGKFQDNTIIPTTWITIALCQWRFAPTNSLLSINFSSFSTFTCRQNCFA